MTPKIRKRLIITTGAIGAVAALLLHYKQRDTYRCQVCFAKKDVLQWRLGSWASVSVPLSPSWERIADTRFLHDFLPSDHVHDWMFAQGSPYYFFGTTWQGCAIGYGRHISDLCRMYESSDEFRAFVLAKLQDGSLSKTNFIALMSCQRTGEPSPLQKEADALIDKFFER